MIKHLTKFSTSEEYYAFIQSGVTLPNVSLVGDFYGGDYNVEYWTDETENYLWMSALEDGQITFTIPSKNQTANIQYFSWSKDNGTTWETVNNVDNQQVVANINVKCLDKVIFKAECESGTNYTTKASETSSTPCVFTSTCRVNLGGNLASLMYGDNFVGVTTMKTSASHAFFTLFSDLKVIDASCLVLPFTTLTNAIYQKLFYNNNTLVVAPRCLPAKSLSQQAYVSMFLDCPSLIKGPQILCTTIGKSAMTSMFRGCVSLTEAPVISATTTLGQSCCFRMFSGCTGLTKVQTRFPNVALNTYCYYGMYDGCTSMTTAPVLPSPTLKGNCYGNMFKGCSNLSYIKALFTTTPSDTYTANWVDGVSANGTFVKKTGASWDVTGVNGVPAGWTVETASS